MTNQWGYIDPVQRAHEERPLYRPTGYGTQQPQVPALEKVQSPLAGLDYAIPQIFQSAGVPRYENVGERMLVGGLIGALIGKALSNRRARKAVELDRLKESLGIGGVEYEGKHRA